MTKNEPLPGNKIAYSKKTVAEFVSDAIIDTTGAKGLLEVLYCYATGNPALMSDDPWNAGFWATLQAAQDRLVVVLDSAEFALKAASEQ